MYRICAVLFVALSSQLLSYVDHVEGLHLNQRRDSETAHAFSLTPSSKFYGDDGSWSAISIRVGTPQQFVDVLVSTASSETWVVSSDACVGSSQETLCSTNRGSEFNSTKSTTWQSMGPDPFALGLDPQLGFGGGAYYGLDTLEFGTTGKTATGSIIASITTQEYWNGFFGLGIIPGNFTTAVAKSPISNLVEDAGLIPSHSYGYTAGASYQQKGEPCSLTLGGYDTNRFVPHDVTFDLNPIHQPEAFLDSILVSIPSDSPGNLSSNPLTLMSHTEGILTVIDSSTPFLWLPKAICERFANALGLTYNETIELYTFDGNSSRHGDIQYWGLNFTFTFANNGTSSEMVNISLPYAAFDLQLSYPWFKIENWGTADANKYYFPLRHAANDTQNTIGRAFLQEAYMIVDYERGNFSLHQAVHIANPLDNTNIVDILRPQNSTFTAVPSVSKKGLPVGAIVGIAVGSVAIILILGLLYWRFARKRRPMPPADFNKEDNHSHHSGEPSRPKSPATPDLNSPVSDHTMTNDSLAPQEMYAPMPPPTELDSSVASVPRSARDGTEKVMFTTYQQALFRPAHNPPSLSGGMNATVLGPEQSEIHEAVSHDEHLTPALGQAIVNPNPGPVPVQSAASFLANMIERKKAAMAEVDHESENQSGNGGTRGQTKDKQRAEEDDIERARYASVRDSWTPGDEQYENSRPQRPVQIPIEEKTHNNANEYWSAPRDRTSTDGTPKLPTSPSLGHKVLIMGRQSFLRGRNREVLD